MKTLTPRQIEVLGVIKGSIERDGKAPTIEEIMAYTGITSKRGVTVHLDALVKKERIVRTKCARRGISLTEPLK